MYILIITVILVLYIYGIYLTKKQNISYTCTAFALITMFIGIVSVYGNENRANFPQVDLSFGNILYVILGYIGYFLLPIIGLFIEYIAILTHKDKNNKEIEINQNQNDQDLIDLLNKLNNKKEDK